MSRRTLAAGTSVDSFQVIRGVDHASIHRIVSIDFINDIRHIPEKTLDVYNVPKENSDNAHRILEELDQSELPSSPRAQRH